MNNLKKLFPLLIVLTPLIFPSLAEACGKYCVHPWMQHGNVQKAYPRYPMSGMNMYPMSGMGMYPMSGIYSMSMNLPHSIRGCVH